MTAQKLDSTLAEVHYVLAVYKMTQNGNGKIANLNFKKLSESTLIMQKHMHFTHILLK